MFVSATAPNIAHPIAWKFFGQRIPPQPCTVVPLGLLPEIFDLRSGVDGIQPQTRPRRRAMYLAESKQGLQPSVHQVFRVYIDTVVYSHSRHHPFCQTPPAAPQV